MADNKQNLIILPGWGGCHETWQDFVNFIEKDFNFVRVIDLPCFGNEPCPEKVWGLAEYTEFVKEKIQSLNLNGGVILLGHSFGGQVAANFAVKHHGIADALILSGAAVLRPRFLVRRIVFGALAKTGKLFFMMPFVERSGMWAKKLFYWPLNSQGYRESAGIKRDIFKKIIRHDLKKVLHRINIPVLILWGDKDRFVNIKYGKKIFKLIPNAKMRVFKNDGHGLHIHNRDEMILEIRKFLKEI